MQSQKLFLFFSCIVCMFLISECNSGNINQINSLPASGDSIKKTIGVESSASSTVTTDSVKETSTTKASYKVAASNCEIKIFKNDSLGFGYDIIVNGKPYVHQPNIPAVPGNRGFSTEESARKAANLVAFKIKNNIMPPSVSIKELDSIGVLK